MISRRSCSSGFLRSSAFQSRSAPRRRRDRPRMFPAKLGEALARGSVVEADIDRAAGHVLGQMERFGWLDHPPRHTVVPQDIEANARIIQQTTERGAVLLKNDGVLPLERADLDSLALIGPGRTADVRDRHRHGAVLSADPSARLARGTRSGP